MTSWNVYLKNEFGNEEKIDTVFFNRDCDEFYVKHSLVSHDNYDRNITVEVQA